MRKLGRIALFVWTITLARCLYGQGNSINSHIFTVIPKPDRSAVGQLNFRDLQSSPFIGGWVAPPTWAANNLRWAMPPNDYEGCLTSNGSLATALNACAHVVAKNMDCVTASASAAHYVCATENTFTPVAGDAFLVKFDVANSAGADLNINSGGAKPIVANTTLAAIGAGTLSIGSWDLCIYDGTHFQCPLGGTSGTISRVFTCGLAGGTTTVPTGDVQLYPTAAYGGTINRVDISGCALSGGSCTTGSITVDIWKAAGAIPTSANKISASAPATLSSSQLAQNGSLTGWTTTVTAGDVFGCSVATVTGITSFTVQVWWQ